MEPTQQFRIAPGVTWDRSDHKVVILNPDGTQMLTLNEVGSTLWPQLSEPVALQSLVASLVEEFEEVDTDQLRSDVEAFVEELGREGLILGVAN